MLDQVAWERYQREQKQDLHNLDNKILRIGLEQLKLCMKPIPLKATRPAAIKRKRRRFKRVCFKIYTQQQY